MCLSPIYIENPNYGYKHLGLLRNIKDTYLGVPCGHCRQCVSMKQSFYEQRIEMDSLNRDLYFMTLTYQNSALRYVNYQGTDIAIADYTDFQKLIKRFRRTFEDRPELSDIRYLCVNEYGSKRYRPHFHVLFSLPKMPDKFNLLRRDELLYDWFKNNWKRNNGTSLKPNWENLYRYVRKRGPKGYTCTFDLHRIIETPDKPFSAVGYYVTKYCLKYDERTTKLTRKISMDSSLDRDTRLDLLRRLTPRARSSKRFGLLDTLDKVTHVQDSILKGIIANKGLSFRFFSPITGKESALCNVYRKKYVTIEHIKLQRNKLLDRIMPDSRQLFESQFYGTGLDSTLNVIQEAQKLSDIQSYLRLKHMSHEDF